MITAVTYGVKISVESVYRKDLSNTENSVFFFNYRVEIENTNSFDVQLLNRHWLIFDSLNPSREVKGDGVVGVQPIIKSGDKYTYVSGCDLHSEMGSMKGFYSIMKLDTNEIFKVSVPKFNMITAPKLN
jgi:ApaG protein